MPAEQRFRRLATPPPLGPSRNKQPEAQKRNTRRRRPHAAQLRRSSPRGTRDAPLRRAPAACRTPEVGATVRSGGAPVQSRRAVARGDACCLKRPLARARREAGTRASRSKRVRARATSRSRAHTHAARKRSAPAAQCTPHEARRVYSERRGRWNWTGPPAAGPSAARFAGAHRRCAHSRASLHASPLLSRDHLRADAVHRVHEERHLGGVFLAT